MPRMRSRMNSLCQAEREAIALIPLHKVAEAVSLAGWQESRWGKGEFNRADGFHLTIPSQEELNETNWMIHDESPLERAIRDFAEAENISVDRAILLMGGKLPWTDEPLPSDRPLSPNPAIFKTYSCNLTKANCADLLRSLAICNGGITQMFTTARNLPEATVGTWSCFFMLRFSTQAHHDKFVARGFKLSEPERIAQ